MNRTKCRQNAGVGIRLLVLALLLMLAAGVSVSTASEPLPDIRIGDGRGDWGHPNPYLHYPRGPGYVRMSWVFDTLIWKDEDGFRPALARSWSYDAEKRAFVFELEPQARWHDGEPLTADDVAFTIELFQEHPYDWIGIDDVSHAEVLGSHEVAIHLRQPYAPFLADIAGTMPIMPAHIWRGIEDPNRFTAPEAFIGSGPYRLVDFNPVQGSYLYEAFADYHLGEPKAKRLVYVRIGQPIAALRNGEVDLVTIRPEMVEPLQRQGFEIIQDERGWNKKLMINHRKAPFDDRRFRQALAHAIDRQEIIDKAQRGHGRLASFGLLSPDHALYSSDTPDHAHDPERALELLRGLGYARGHDGFLQKAGTPLRIELLVSNITAGGQTAADRDGEVIKAQLERIGIRTELVNLEQGSTDTRVRDWNFDLAVSGHGGISGDARILNEMISSAHGAGSVNSARFDAHPELNALLDQQLRAMDPEERREIVARIQHLHAEELPAIPLYYPDSFAAFDPAKGVRWFFTPGGIAKGIPIPHNKVSLLP
ncbi:ABC transporter substrate-binding protein [Thioalkalivibrio paradoxus]|uniref:Peptide-binding protein n=1 Tax=Thioalkalivibrio paradoxus ARh 1 TaxID=713585 RepID=W0DJM2_9GAMM|nr:ABC transporter substrate-binding protein [Thioalkalivibrio paradoxus]AHE97090.1 peptide-binding protein [Thioalkalivibrio paradoxus ARh 1]